MTHFTRNILTGFLILVATNTAWAQTKAIIETDMGNIHLTLDEVKAPKTVANFVSYAKQGFYDNTIFHRVIDNFMIQGGGMTNAMLPKQTAAPIENEASNGLKNIKGSIAMARTQDPHSASSQFFINLQDNAFLDHRGTLPSQYGYAVFGKVTQGMEVVEQIGRTRTGYRLGHMDVPLQPITIKRIRIVK